MQKRPYILTIAGFDPSGGAGLLADIKTMEMHRCIGFAVQTANTIQTEDRFESPNWIDEATVLKQLDFLLEEYTFDYVKIGLIHNLTLVNTISKKLMAKNSQTKIIWDPVLSVSAGYDFDHDLSNLTNVLAHIYMLTPNWNEISRMSNEKDPLKIGEELSKHCKVYLKGGHNTTHLGKDYLIYNGETRSFNPKIGEYHPKHGSGCVFSAALVANLAKGYPEQKAILRSKRYVEQFLASTKTLLGHHYA